MVKISLCTLQRHKGSGCTAQLILILGTRWGKWSSSRPGRFILCKAPWVPTEQEAGWAWERVWTFWEEVSTVTVGNRNILLLTYLFTYSLALRSSESLCLLNYRRSFFSAHRLLSPSFNFHLPQIILNIFHPPQSMSSNSSSSIRFTLKYFSNTLTRSILTRCPVHSTVSV